MRKMLLIAVVAFIISFLGVRNQIAQVVVNDDNHFDGQIEDNAKKMIREGRRTFRFDTFGDESFWGDTLKLHQGIERVTPRQALAVGLKIDVNALPPDVIQAIQTGQVNLDDPAVTLLLLKLNAVLGVTGFFFR